MGITGLLGAAAFWRRHRRRAPAQLPGAEAGPDRAEELRAKLAESRSVEEGLAPEDLLFDPLVLPVSTGMETDRRSGLETIEGVRRIAARFPQCQTTVGLSNVSRARLEMLRPFDGQFQAHVQSLG